MGLGTQGLQDRMHLDDRALLLYAGLFVHQPRSLSALEDLLADFFQVNVTAAPWQGQGLDLPEDEYTYIGIKKGQNHVIRPHSDTWHPSLGSTKPICAARWAGGPKTIWGFAANWFRIYLVM
jgi:predicted component of type VI protein secretion system